MDDLFARRVVLRGGEAQSRAVWKLHNVLHRTFSERRFAHKNRPAQILQRAGYDFGTAGAAFVHEHGERKARTLFRGARGRIIMLLRSDASLCGNDLCIGRQKLRADIDRHVQESARIISEIEHQRLHATLLQVIERLPQFLRGRFVKLNQADVTDLERTAQIRVEYSGPLYALHFDLCPFEGEIFDLFGGGTQNRQRHFLPNGAAQEVDRILQLHFFGRVSVDPQNLIAGKNARLCRRRVFHWCDDSEQPPLHRDLNAKAVEPAARVVLHVLEVIRLHELAVWIERGEHAFQRGIN